MPEVRQGIQSILVGYPRQWSSTALITAHEAGYSLLKKRLCVSVTVRNWSRTEVAPRRDQSDKGTHFIHVVSRRTHSVTRILRNSGTFLLILTVSNGLEENY